jgi:hypothetical protein
MAASEVYEVFNPRHTKSNKRLACWIKAVPTAKGPRLHIISVMRTLDHFLPPGDSIAVLRKDQTCWIAKPVQFDEKASIEMRPLGL